MPFRLTQVTFRGRDDDGSETTATWKDIQGNDWTQLVDINFRVRFRLDEVGSVAWSNKTFNLRYSRNGGAYTAVGAGQPVIYSASGNFVQGDDCTAQLTGGTGTFVTNNNGMCESAGATNSGSAGYLFEAEYCIQIVKASVNHGDTISLRVYDGNSTIYAYTDTPVITVSKPVELTAVGFDTGVPVLDASMIGQVHALISEEISAGAPVLGTPELAENAPPVNLEATNITSGIPVLGNPSIGQIHNLEAAGITNGSHVLGNPFIGQVHHLETEGIISGAPIVDNASLAQVHILGAVGINTAAVDIGNPIINQTQNLIAVGISTSNPILGTPTLEIIPEGADELIALDINTGDPVLEEAIIGQIHGLSAGLIDFGYPILDSPVLSEVGENEGIPCCGVGRGQNRGMHRRMRKVNHA